MLPCIILDEIIDKEKQDVIEDYMFSGDVDWQMTRNVHFRKSQNPEVDLSKSKKLIGFKHRIFDFGKIRTEKHFDLFAEISENISKRLHWQVQINHIRGAMFPNVAVPEKSGIPHIDFRDQPEHKIVLYYVNDIDGDTVLFKNTTKDTSSQLALQENNLTEMISVKPKKGRCVIFDGDRYHATGRPRVDFRCVLNYNIEVIE